MLVKLTPCFTFNIWWPASDVGKNVDQDEEEGHQ